MARVEKSVAPLPRNRGAALELKRHIKIPCRCVWQCRLPDTPATSAHERGPRMAGDCVNCHKTRQQPEYGASAYRPGKPINSQYEWIDDCFARMTFCFIRYGGRAVRTESGTSGNVYIQKS